MLPAISRRTKVVLTFILLVVGGYVTSIWGRSFRDVPAGFKKARLESAMIAQNIVSLSNQLTVDLATINKYDRERKYADALLLITEVLKRNEEVRREAVRLSTQVEDMTRTLEDIDSAEARQAALAAIASRLALISRLVNYSNYLGDLLTTLRDRFSGRPSDANVANLVAQINAEVTAINNFDREAVAAMEEFDRIVKQ